MLDKDSEVYTKELAKYLNWKKENKDGKLWKSITEDKNIQLYDVLVEKMNTGIFIKKYLINMMSYQQKRYEINLKILVRRNKPKYC